MGNFQAQQSNADKANSYLQNMVDAVDSAAQEGDKASVQTITEDKK